MKKFAFAFVLLALAGCSSETGPESKELPLLRADQQDGADEECNEVCAESYPPMCFRVCAGDEPPGPGADDPVSCIVDRICAESYPPQCRDVCLDETVPADECPDSVVVKNEDGEEIEICVEGSGEPGEPGAEDGEEPSEGI